MVAKWKFASIFYCCWITIASQILSCITEWSSPNAHLLLHSVYIRSWMSEIQVTSLLKWPCCSNSINSWKKPPPTPQNRFSTLLGRNSSITFFPSLKHSCSTSTGQCSVYRLVISKCTIVALQLTRFKALLLFMCTATMLECEVGVWWVIRVEEAFSWKIPTQNSGFLTFNWKRNTARTFSYYLI